MPSNPDPVAGWQVRPVAAPGVVKAQPAAASTSTTTRIAFETPTREAVLGME